MARAVSTLIHFQRQWRPACRQAGYDTGFNAHDVTITYGHSKDHRTDLKQFTLGMATEKRGIPLFLQTLSGNASDKKTLVQILTHLKDNLQNPSKVYYIADSAFYPDENITTVGIHTFWISRVPATLKEVKTLVSSDGELFPCADERYQYAEHRSEYAGIAQKWVMYQSEDLQKRQERTFQKTLERKRKTAQTSLRKLSAQKFACIPDAESASKKWLSENTLFRFVSCEIAKKTHKKSQKRGRPKASEEMEAVYSISAEIEYDEKAVNRLRTEQGRFVLATNDMELSADELLKNYKA
jgi:transposase